MLIVWKVYDVVIAFVPATCEHFEERKNSTMSKCQKRNINQLATFLKDKRFVRTMLNFWVSIMNIKYVFYKIYKIMKPLKIDYI